MNMSGISDGPTGAPAPVSGFASPRVLTLAEARQVLAAYNGRPLTLMEVCGTHTAAIAAGGLQALLPRQVRLVSGPGCPVCVTPARWFDELGAMARQHGIRVACFGDLIRVPGDCDSLAAAMADGAPVHMIYSPLDALELCRTNPDDTIVVAAAGFETTAPAYALLMRRARAHGIRNLRLFTALRRMPPVLDRLCDPDVAIDGFLAPGHVSAIIGSDAYIALAARSGKPFVVASFDPERLIVALAMLLQLAGHGDVVNLYQELVQPEGNLRARQVLDECYRIEDAEWRGLGMIPDSGYGLAEAYADFQPIIPAVTRPALPLDPNLACRCGDVLLGRIMPEQCPMFGRRCRPETPVGPCMVSSEGVCGIHYRFPDAATP